MIPGTATRTIRDTRRKDMVDALALMKRIISQMPQGEPILTDARRGLYDATIKSLESELGIKKGAQS